MKYRVYFYFRDFLIYMIIRLVHMTNEYLCSYFDRLRLFHITIFITSNRAFESNL